MESKLRIKIKLVAIFILFCICMMLLSLNKISAESLLSKVNLDKVVVETNVQGQVNILDQNEAIDVTVKETKQAENILTPEDAILEESDTAYIVKGKIDSAYLNSDLTDKVLMKYVFDKKTKEFIESTAVLNNQLDETISNTVVEEVSNSNNITEQQANNVVNVESNSTIKIIPTEEEYTESVEETLKNKLEVFNRVTIDTDIKTVKIGDASYILGESIYTQNTTSNPETMSEFNNTTKDIIKDDVLYHIIGTEDKGIVYGVSGTLDKISYLSESTIIEKLGEPTITGKSKYWNIKVDNEEINIVINGNAIEILYKC